jgi:hypothetical protein
LYVCSPSPGSHNASSRPLDATDQLVELDRRVANIVRKVADHFQRLLGLPDLHQFADKILTLLQVLQKASELRPRLVELLSSTFSLRLELAPLVN